MRASEAAIGGKANADTGALVGIDRQGRRQISAVMRVARSLWPRKTAHELAERTGVTLRQAERWLTGNYGISSEALRDLIRSEEGFRFLEALVDEIGNGAPEWWAGFKKQVLAAQLQAEIAEARQRYRDKKRQAFRKA